MFETLKLIVLWEDGKIMKSAGLFSTHLFMELINGKE